MKHSYQYIQQPASEFTPPAPPKEWIIEKIKREFANELAGKLPILEEETIRGETRFEIVAHVYTEDQMHRIYRAMRNLKDECTADLRPLFSELERALDL